MLDFIVNTYIFAVASWQAGFYMIPRIGHQQMIEAWAGSTITKPVD